MNTPAISVVMGVCNGAGHLPETIASVLAQTEPDWEFILVNDGSTDPAVEALLAEYAQRDARIRLITKAHAGLTRALADGCAAARGEYIARIDVGDAMLPERLVRQRAVFEQEPRIAFVSCWTEFCGPRWERIEIKKEQPTGAAGMPIGSCGHARTHCWLGVTSAQLTTAQRLIATARFPRLYLHSPAISTSLSSSPAIRRFKRAARKR